MEPHSNKAVRVCRHSALCLASIHCSQNDWGIASHRHSVCDGTLRPILPSQQQQQSAAAAARAAAAAATAAGARSPGRVGAQVAASGAVATSVMQVWGGGGCAARPGSCCSACCSFGCGICFCAHSACSCACSACSCSCTGGNTRVLPLLEQQAAVGAVGPLPPRYLWWHQQRERPHAGQGCRWRLWHRSNDEGACPCLLAGAGGVGRGAGGHTPPAGQYDGAPQGVCASGAAQVRGEGGRALPLACCSRYLLWAGRGLLGANTYMSLTGRKLA